MTLEQVDLVQSTWEKVVPIAGMAAGLFYGRGIELAPDVQSMFPDDIAARSQSWFPF